MVTQNTFDTDLNHLSESVGIPLAVMNVRSQKNTYMFGEILLKIEFADGSRTPRCLICHKTIMVVW